MDKFFQIRVIPNAKKNLIKEDQGRLKVYLTVPAVEGKANKSLIEILSEYFSVKKSQIQILKGEKSRDKLIKIG